MLLKLLEQGSNIVSDYLPMASVNQSKEIMFVQLYALIGDKDISENAKKAIIGKLNNFI